MNKKSTFRQKWRGFKEYCQQPKTRFDIKDRARALLIFLALALFLYALVQVFVN